MNQKISETDWADILEKFSTYEGTIVSFCEKYKVNHHKLYYQRKKTNREKTSFYPISLRTEPTSSSQISQHQESIIDTKPIISNIPTIKVEIGKAKIYIPTNGGTALTLILKELVQLC